MTGLDTAALDEAHRRGLALAKAGDTSGAAEAFRRCLELDPDDHAGAALRLAAIGEGATPERAPEVYVATLFNQQAEAFDDILLGQLGYRVPKLLAARLKDLAPGPYRRLLDLGCGTGLAGAALAGAADEIWGVDLSEGMVEVAHARGVYHRLFVAEAVHFLRAPGEPFDLVVAADMLPYLGAAEPLFAGVAARLEPGGVFAFSAEALAAGDFAVGPHHRFAHGEAYLRRLMGEHGFSCLALEPITGRHEQGRPVPGWLGVAKKL